MIEIRAVMGLVNLDRMDKIVAKNHANYLSYANAFSGITGTSLLSYDVEEKNPMPVHR